MILYFDSYITDIPFNKKFVDPNKWIRHSVPSYAMPSKIDIAKYTLASYAEYPWSHVLVRYRLEDTARNEEFENYVKELFPNAVILQPNSSNQTEYKKSVNIINEWTDDDWIWYAPNNDHPILTNELNLIDKCLSLAKEQALNNDFVSIMYSHFSEFINMPKKGSPFNQLFGKDTTIIDNSESAVIYKQENGDNTGIQIVNKKLLNYWFNSKDLGDAVIFRSEDVRKFFTTPNQIIIVPKKEIAAHFDGYSHTINGLAEITADQVPPLMIPSGFFTNSINIRYGFDKYDKNATNINPLAKSFSFEDDKCGTDLKITKDQIPKFWSKHIAKFEENPKLDTKLVSAATKARERIINNPYNIRSKNCSVSTLKYCLRHLKRIFGIYKLN